MANRQSWQGKVGNGRNKRAVVQRGPFKQGGLSTPQNSALPGGFAGEPLFCYLNNGGKGNELD